MESSTRREGVDVKALPVLLHSMLTQPPSSSPVALAYNAPSWTELLMACQSSQTKGDDAGNSVVFAQKVEECLKISASESPAASSQTSGLDKKNLKSLTKATQPWLRTRGEYKETERVLFNSEVEKKPGYRCDNKAAVQISASFDFGSGVPGPSSQAPQSEWMDATAKDHSAWQQRRLQILKRRMIANMAASVDVPPNEAPTQSPAQVPQVVRVGQLAGGEGRPFSFVSMVLDDVAGNRESVQLLYTEETLTRQHRQLKESARRRQSEDTSTYAQESRAAATGEGENGSTPVCRDGRTEEICAYPGMLIAVRGVLRKTEFGTKLSVSSFHGGPPLPSPTSRHVLSVPLGPVVSHEGLSKERCESRTVASCYRGNPVHIMLASAQNLVPLKTGTMSRNLELDLLLDRVREEVPHILILFGPIVPASALISLSVSSPAAVAGLPDVDWTYTAFFRQVASRLAGTRTRVFVVPSTADVAHPHPLPQPPYSSDLVSSDPFIGLPASARQQISFLPNPCFLYVNELRLLVTAEDPLMEIGAQVAYPSCIGSHQDLIAACCSSLLRQRTLFPSGASSTLPVDPKRFPPRMFDVAEDGEDSIPHIVVFPSDANVSGGTDPSQQGAFACIADERLFVLPFSPKLVREASARAEWTSIYIQPPPAKEGNEESMEADIKDKAYDETMGRKPEGEDAQPLSLKTRVTVRHSSYALA
ncbi:DNA polymerase epsilon subunit B protein [Toxoplasma gondii CAST]|uniref:DNA polymerase alpha subunit B n=1 Tax=Toxoplasma gondii CAST TaxID=943122 RepID=A0A425I880_TOXGO|nr:DNA polymerase epsilon subunit B protein [Toxoplasma gondii CAST]